MPGPYVLVGHSYGGLITRLYASTYPDEVVGMVLVDVLSPELRAQMSPQDWDLWKVVNARKAEDIAEYPPLERIDPDQSLDQVERAAPIKAMPLACSLPTFPLPRLFPGSSTKASCPPKLRETSA